MQKVRARLFIWFVMVCATDVFAEPNLASVSAVAVDVNSGEMLITEHADLVLPIASLTKVMTAMVVLDSKVDLNEWLEIKDWDAKTTKNGYSRIRLTSQAKRKDLLRIALMSSENRASYNLAKHHPGGFDAFVSAMNNKAKSLGMQNSQFADPTGLELGNRSTAADLAKMLLAAYEYPVIKTYSTTRAHTVNFRKPRYRLGYGNTNPLTNSSRWAVDLSKTGYLTEAGRCLVMVTEMAEKTVAVVLLNSLGTRSPLGDAGRIKRWLLNGANGTVAQAAVKHRVGVLAKLGRSG